MKFKKLLVLLLFVMLLSTGCGKKSNLNESSNDPDSISFSQLKEIAVEPMYAEINNYIIFGAAYDIDANSAFVNCLGSYLSVSYENSKYVLKNIKTNQVICSDVYRNAIIDYNGKFSSKNYVFANSTIPVAIYATYNSGDSTVIINYVDSYGSLLRTESLPSGSYKYLYSVSTKKVGEYNYFYISQADGYSEDVYFRYQYKDNKYNVESITQNEYNNASTSTDAPQYEYTDNLIECYDCNGQIFAYYYTNNRSYFLYDANKHYLNNISLTSFGFDSYTAVLRLEKKLCFFKNENYYESELNKGSNPTYKCRCLEIDLSNGQVTYNDDFKYYVVSAKSIISNNAFDYCYLMYYEVKDNGELDKMQKCVILKDKFSFDNAFIYDGFSSNVYIVDDNTLLASFDTGLYLITQNERTRINGISIISFFENGDVIYQNIDNKYYTCKLSNILNAIKQFEGGVSYLSTNTYNGKKISYDYDYNTGKYTANGLELNSNYLNYAQRGIYVTNNCVYVDNNKVVDGGNLIINQIAIYSTIGEFVIYRVRLTDSTYKYFIYNSIKEER